MNTLKMQPNKTTGLLLTFCGLDGCGKTTMIQKVVSELQKEHEVFLTKQPTDFVRNSAIFRTYMDCADHSAYNYRSLSLLAASDRVQHDSHVINPELEKGKIVVSDRYFYSCLANLRARGFENDRWIYEIAESITRPDIAFFFDVPVETAVARVRSRAAEKNRYIDMKLQYRLRKEYQNICRENGGVLISTDQSPDETFEQVMSAIRTVIKEKTKASEKVLAVLRDLSGKQSISPIDSLQGDLGLDSLKMVTLLIKLEEAFGIELQESDMNPYQLFRVADVYQLMEKYKGDTP